MQRVNDDDAEIAVLNAKFAKWQMTEEEYNLQAQLIREDAALAEQEAKALADESELTLIQQQNQRKLELTAAFNAEKAGIDFSYHKQAVSFSKAVKKGEWAAAAGHGAKMLGGAAKQFAGVFKLQKAFSLAKAVMELPAAVQSSWNAAGGYPMGIIPAGVMLATGLSNISKIKSGSFSQAHSGLTNVPREGTFLLDKGERVIKRDQNRDLTDFLAEGGVGGGTSIETLEMTIVIENGESLIEMEETELQTLLADKFIPALDALSSQGIRQQDFTVGEQL